MNKNKKLKKQQIDNDKKYSSKELQTAIVNALREYDREKEQREQEKLKKERYERLHPKVYPLRNLAFLLKVIFPLPTKEYNEMRNSLDGIGNTILIFKILLSTVFIVLSPISLLLFCMLVYKAVLQGLVHLWVEMIMYFSFSILALLFSGVFRCVAIEIDNSDDYNFLFGLFSSIVAIISLVIAVIALKD